MDFVLIYFIGGVVSLLFMVKKFTAPYIKAMPIKDDLDIYFISGVTIFTCIFWPVGIAVCLVYKFIKKELKKP